MKRKGYIYQRMEDWNLLVEAERVAVKGKAQNKGVRLHREQWMQNRIEINNRPIGTDSEGRAIYLDTKETVSFT